MEEILQIQNNEAQYTKKQKKKIVGMGVAKKWIGSSGLAGANYYIESI